MSDAEWIAVCDPIELPLGAIRRIVHPKGPVAVYHIDDGFFATADTCTHGIASLSEGTLDGDVIECPYHGGAFSVKTGRPESTPCTIPLKTFATEIRGGRLHVAVAAQP